MSSPTPSKYLYFSYFSCKSLTEVVITSCVLALLPLAFPTTTTYTALSRDLSEMHGLPQLLLPATNGTEKQP